MEAGQSAEVLSRIAERDAERKDRLAEAAAERCDEVRVHACLRQS